MLFNNDLFISYASENKDIADYIVDKIEKRGYKCFIAPRNIRTGSEYAVEIIRGISNSTAVLLVFSSKSEGPIMFFGKSTRRFLATVRLFLLGLRTSFRLRLWNSTWGPRIGWMPFLLFLMFIWIRWLPFFPG